MTTRDAPSWLLVGPAQLDSTTHQHSIINHSITAPCAASVCHCSQPPQVLKFEPCRARASRQPLPGISRGTLIHCAHVMLPLPSEGHSCSLPGPQNAPAATASCLAGSMPCANSRAPVLVHSLPTDPLGDPAATARCLAGKLGAQPDRVLLALMNDRMVAKGTILQWATVFFQVPRRLGLRVACDAPQEGGGTPALQQRPCPSAGHPDVCRANSLMK